MSFSYPLLTGKEVADYHVANPIDFTPFIDNLLEITPEERGQINDILSGRKDFAEVVKNGPLLRKIEQLYPFKERYEKCVQSGLGVALLNHQQPIGLAVATPWGCANDMFMGDLLSVLPPFKGQGLSKALISNVVDLAFRHNQCNKFIVTTKRAQVKRQLKADHSNWEGKEVEWSTMDYETFIRYANSSKGYDYLVHEPGWEIYLGHLTQNG